MSDKTGIEWTDATWNPIRGCSRVSEGCRNCYAESVAARFSGPGMPYEGLARRTESGEARWTGKVRVVESAIEQPLRWKRPRRIFVNSMSDLFHEQLSNDDIASVFRVMAQASWHTFQVLTKRPQRMLEWFDWADGLGLAPDGRAKERGTKCFRDGVEPPWPLPNVWLGASVESDDVTHRIETLRKVPAAVRFLSCEPLIGRIEDVDLSGIGWVIAGGESGRNARPMQPGWARDLRNACQDAGVPFFFKQWGEWAPANRGAGDDIDISRFNPESIKASGFFTYNDDWIEDESTVGLNPFRQSMVRVGKKAAGSTLDGVDHKAFPGAVTP